ncbi:MAG: F0F1 ATP synthase subunit gamma [Pseudomonadales bacterium]|jgi:F-type H+-transporting ATPase subunit gamma
MEQLTRLKARTENLEDLRELMRAMRALAASHVQSAQSALEGIRTYTSVVEDAIVEGMELAGALSLGRLPAAEPDGEVLILIGAEHGFVGALNDELVDHARSQLHPGGSLGVVGTRTADTASEQGLEIGWTEPMSTQARGVPGTARRVADRLAGVARAELIYAAYERGGDHTIEQIGALPLDTSRLERAPLRAPPLHHLPAAVLLERLAGEYLLALVTRAVMESFASENGARLRVMEAADRTIDTRLAKLDLQLHTLRQAAITEELLDVITGAEAIMSGGQPD